jgi:hypothetical protein
LFLICISNTPCSEKDKYKQELRSTIAVPN